MRQKLIIFLAITLGVFIFGIGKVQAADINLSPSTGVAGTQFTINGSEFMPHFPLVIAQWDDSDPLEISNKQFDGDDRYVSSTAQVPMGASVGQHKITVTVSAGALMYGPKHYWFSYVVPRAWAADGASAETFFTVTAPPVTPPANTNTAVVNSNTQSSNINTNTTVKSASNKNSTQTVVAETPAPAVTTNENTNEQTALNEPTNEVKKEAKVCYFPWWLWLVLIIITVVNLILFWLRFWKKKPKQGE